MYDLTTVDLISEAAREIFATLFVWAVRLAIMSQSQVAKLVIDLVS